MSVSVGQTVGNFGLYVPFRGFDREAGPVGTLFVDVSATGDGSGGTVTLGITMKRLEFGFHPIWVPTRVSSLDGLASPEAVEFMFRSSGNERLNGDLREPALGVAVAGGNNLAAFNQLGVAVEPTNETAATVLQCLWSTNTNAVVYHLHAFGVLYDAEALARGKRSGKAPDVLLGGVR